MDEACRITGFHERGCPSPDHYLNAAICLFGRHMAYEIPAEHEVSLERGVLPLWLREGRHIKDFVYRGKCIDIGTPERYGNAQTVLSSVEEEMKVIRCENPL